MIFNFCFELFERVPAITPNRWNLISEIVQDCQNLTVSDECPKVYLGGGEKGKSFGRLCSSPKQYEDLDETLKIYWTVKQRSQSTVHRIRDPVFHSCILVMELFWLLCFVEFVKAEITVHCTSDQRPSFPLLYTRHGTFLAAMFRGICKSRDHSPLYIGSETQFSTLVYSSWNFFGCYVSWNL